MAKRQLPGLGLTGFWPEGTDHWGDENDANLRLLSALVQAQVKSTVDAVPSEAADGDMYLMSLSSPNPNAIVIRDAGAWVYIAPKQGWLVYSIADTTYRSFDGGAWNKLATGSSGGGGSGSSPVGAHRYWTVEVRSALGNDYMAIAKLEVASAVGGAALPISSITAYPPGNGNTAVMTDNDLGTFWYSQYQSTPDTLLLDMGSPVSIGEVRLTTRSGYTTQSPALLRVETSDDGKLFKPVSTALNASAGSDNQVRSFPISTSYVGFGNSGGGSSAYRPSFFVAATPANAETLFLHSFSEVVKLAKNFAGAAGKCLTPPSSPISLAVQLNGSTIGQIAINTAGAVSFISSDVVTVGLGDMLSVIAPAASNGLANLAVTFSGVIQ